MNSKNLIGGIILGIGSVAISVNAASLPELRTVTVRETTTGTVYFLAPSSPLSGGATVSTGSEAAASAVRVIVRDPSTGDVVTSAFAGNVVPVFVRKGEAAPEVSLGLVDAEEKITSGPATALVLPEKGGISLNDSLDGIHDVALSTTCRKAALMLDFFVGPYEPPVTTFEIYRLIDNGAPVDLGEMIGTLESRCSTTPYHSFPDADRSWQEGANSPVGTYFVLAYEPARWWFESPNYLAVSTDVQAECW